ncbi:MAG: class I SAM-dependent methyltransferase [Parvibaculum sp.]|nr:class I SAM-dependent methyltransferase [Parvibaculum sp.]
MSDVVLDQSALMDRVYRQQRHFYDVTRAWYLLGRDRMLQSLRPKIGDRILEMGCGTGRNLIAAIRTYPLAQYYGVDISSEMLTTARRASNRAGLGHQLSFAQGDATRFDPQLAFGQTGFECIFMSYTLSMIPDWQGALSHALSHLPARGELHIVDFGQQERLPALFRMLLFKWLDLFHVSPRADLHAVLEALAMKHSATLTFTPLYRGYAWSAVLRMQ